MSRHATSPLIFFGLALLGYQLWVVCDVLAKLGGANLTAWQIALFSSLITGLALILRAHLKKRLAADLRVRNWHPIIARIICANAFIVLSVVLVQRMSLVDFYTAAYLVPLLTALGGHFLLKEKLTPLLWGAIGLGLLGALIAVRGGAEAGGSSLTLWALAFLNALALAGGMLCIRWGSATESTLALGLYVYIVNVAICLVVLAIDPSQWRLDMPSIAICILYGVLNAAAVIMLLEAYHRAPSGLVAPAQYSQFVLGALLGWLLFGDVLTATGWLGAGLIIAAGMLISFSQSRLSLRRQ